MKIGILTIYGGTNYGNKLQNYALQQFLRLNGIMSETIQYTVRFQFPPVGKFRQLSKKYFSKGLSESIWNCRCLIKKYCYISKLKEKEINRAKRIKTFEEKHVIVSAQVFDKVSLSSCNSLYTKVIVGSDQVWNPNWQGKEDEFFLSFVDKNKRVAYAPSIGVSEIPEQQKDRYARLLSGIDFLSCREKDGAELIRDLCHKECKNVVDPVFLLDRDEWLEICDKDSVNTIGKDYIVTYFLGGKSRRTNNIIKKYAKANKLNVIDIYNSEDIMSVFAGIEEFLQLISNAEMVFTDSFHGSAFSIIFGRQFVVCDRRFQAKHEKMSSRIDGLLEKIGICGRSINEDTWKKEKIDYSAIKEKLYPWIKESKEFLLSQIDSLKCEQDGK